MSFGQAVSSGFGKYAEFSGRARRSEYWYWVLFVFLVFAAAVIADNAFGSTVGAGVGWITLVLSLLLFLPNLAITVRRLHDTGRSGWWWWLSFLCGIGAVIVLVFCLQDSQPGDNEYGPSAKAA